MARRIAGFTEADRYASRRLRALREAAGLTQGQLAGLVGMSFQMVHKYESTECRLSTGRLDRFARALGCAPADFFAAGAPRRGTLAELDDTLDRQVVALPPPARTALRHWLRALADAAAGGALTTLAATGAPGAAGGTQVQPAGDVETQPRTRPMGPATSGPPAASTTRRLP